MNPNKFLDALTDLCGIFMLPSCSNEQIIPVSKRLAVSVCYVTFTKK